MKVFKKPDSWSRQLAPLDRVKRWMLELIADDMAGIHPSQLHVLHAAGLLMLRADHAAAFAPAAAAPEVEAAVAAAVAADHLSSLAFHQVELLRAAGLLRNNAAATEAADAAAAASAAEAAGHGSSAGRRGSPCSVTFSCPDQQHVLESFRKRCWM